MKIAFPTQEDSGADSPVFSHFGSAKYFIIADSETEQFEVIANQDKDHQHGMCQPMAALGGKPIHGVVVGGIGLGALNKLNHAGIRIYRAVEGTVAENMALVKVGKLPEFTPEMSCAGHSNDGMCLH